MKITKITKVKPKRVYAIQTSTETYVADGLAHHNCYGCNCGQNGMWVEYEDAMLREYTPEQVDEMKRRRHKTVQYKASDYEEIEQKYKDKFNELKGR